MEIIDIEIEIQPGIRTQIIDRSNNCAIVGIFVELLLFLVNYPNNSLTRGGAFREPSGFPFDPPRRHLRLGGYYFFGLISRSFFFQKKCILGGNMASKWHQNWLGKRPQMQFLHFSGNLDFERPSIDFCVFLGFHSPWNGQETIKNVTVKQHWKMIPAKLSFSGKMLKKWPQNGSRKLRW